MNDKKKEESNRRWYLKKKERLCIKNRAPKLDAEEKTERRKETTKKYREKKAKELSEYRKNYYENNKDKYKKYGESRSEYHTKYIQNRRTNDKLFKLMSNIRHRISQSLKLRGYSKKSKTQEILGCSFEEFKSYLESKFEPWMTWENYGLYNGELNCGWDLDHIIPVSSANTESELVSLNHFTNFQPLCSYTNRYIKKNIYTK